MTFFDQVLIIMIISFLVLLIWSKVEHKTIIEVLNEIKEFFTLKEQ